MALWTNYNKELQEFWRKRSKNNNEISRIYEDHKSFVAVENDIKPEKAQ